MTINWRYKFGVAFNSSRYLILLSLLLFSSGCSSYERIGDRGDCSDVNDGTYYDGTYTEEFYSLRSKQEIDIDNLMASLKSWNSTTRYKALLILFTNTEPHTLVDTYLATVQDEDPRIRQLSIKGLGWATESQETLIPQILPILTQATEDEDPGVRAASFSELIAVALQQKALIPQIVPLVRNGYKDRSACVRTTTVGFSKGLVVGLEPDTNELKLIIADLILVASRDSSVWARIYAMENLGEVNVASEEIIPALVMLLKHDPNAKIRTIAAMQLHNKAAEPESTKALIASINDPDASVRIASVYSLLKIKPSSLTNPINLKKLSEQGLETAIWVIRRKTREDIEDLALDALMAERKSRLDNN